MENKKDFAPFTTEMLKKVLAEELPFMEDKDMEKLIVKIITTVVMGMLIDAPRGK